MAIKKKTSSSETKSKGQSILVPWLGEKPSLLGDSSSSREIDLLGVPLCAYERSHSVGRESDVLAELALYEWGVFLDEESVHAFFKCFFKKFSDARCLGPMRIACLDEATANALQGYRYAVDLVKSESLEQELLDTSSLDNAKVLIVGAEGDGDGLIKFLESEGRAIVDYFPIYKKTWLDSGFEDAQEEAVAIVFSSEAVFDGFLKCADVFARVSRKKRLLTLAANEEVASRMKSKKLPVDAVLKGDLSVKSVEEALAMAAEG